MRNYTSSYDVVQSLPKRSFMIVRFWWYGRWFLCEPGLSELGLSELGFIGCKMVGLIVCLSRHGIGLHFCNDNPDSGLQKRS